MPDFGFYCLISAGKSGLARVLHCPLSKIFPGSSAEINPLQMCIDVCAYKHCPAMDCHVLDTYRNHALIGDVYVVHCVCLKVQLINDTIVYLYVLCGWCAPAWY